MASRKTPPPAAAAASTQDGETVTYLKMAGLTVLMVQKKDQVIYKLPDNMAVNLLSTEQREQLLKEINQLHSRQVATAAAATAAAATAATTTAATAAATDAATTTAATTTPNLATSAPAKPVAGTQYPTTSTTATPSSTQNGTPSTSRVATPGTSVFPVVPASKSSSPPTNSQPVKTTRKYTKTGKYSKKKLQQQQQQQQQQDAQAGGGNSGSSGSGNTTATATMKPAGTTTSVSVNSLQQRAADASSGVANTLESNPQWILLTEIHTLQLRQQAQQILLSHYRDQDTIMKTMMAANPQDVPHQDRSVLARNISEVEQLLNIIKAQVEIKEKVMLSQFDDMSKRLQQMATQHHLLSLQQASRLGAPKPLPTKGYSTTLTMATILSNLTPLELFQIQDLQKLQQQQKQLVIQAVTKPGLGSLTTSVAGMGGFGTTAMGAGAGAANSTAGGAGSAAAGSTSGGRPAMATGSGGEAATGPPVPDIPAPLAKEMQEHNAQIMRAVHAQLWRDQEAIGRMDYKRPFSSLEDAVERLLPFHLYQFPWQELEAEEKAFHSEAQQEKWTAQAKLLHTQRDRVFERYNKLVKREASRATSANPELELLATKLLYEDERAEHGVVKVEHDRVKQEASELQRVLEIREAQAALQRKQEAMLIEQQQKLMLEREKERLRLEADRQAAVHASAEQTSKALQGFQQNQQQQQDQQQQQHEDAMLKSHEELLQRQLEQRQVLLQQEQQQLQQKQATAASSSPLPGSAATTPKQ
ncbi:hypothetical protein DFQ26_002984 [Actinomortierella ambigua]|nr:hypothetical protein DFQ26_002984 [Actinomortierella ambigua]